MPWDPKSAPPNITMPPSDFWTPKKSQTSNSYAKCQDHIIRLAPSDTISTSLPSTIFWKQATIHIHLLVQYILLSLFIKHQSLNYIDSQRAITNVQLSLEGYYTNAASFHRFVNPPPHSSLPSKYFRKNKVSQITPLRYFRQLNQETNCSHTYLCKLAVDGLPLLQLAL